jgi:L-seryl-tRNA(Ser) seleniumtransferase
VQRSARAGEVAPDQMVRDALVWLPATAATSRPVLIATGVVVHINLNPALLSAAAWYSRCACPALSVSGWRV